MPNPYRRKLLSLLASATLLEPYRLAWPQSTGKARHVVILIPGITGSVLSVQGKEVWSPSAQGIIRAILTLGASLDSLKLAADPVDEDDLGDGVVPERLVNDLHMLPGLWRIDGYTKVARAIALLPGLERGKNFFEFPYDWRRDNRVSARRLERAARRWLSEWKVTSGQSDPKLVIVAHSMGGLVARYFIECLEGWKITKSLISFGTPYRGSLNALDMLHNGLRINGGPIQIASATALLRSFTSVYQLLPTYPCIEVDGSVVRVSEAGEIDHLEQQKVKAGLQFHREIADAMKANQASEAYLRQRCQVHPVVGISQETLQFAKKEGRSVALSGAFPASSWTGRHRTATLRNANRIGRPEQGTLRGRNA